MSQASVEELTGVEVNVRTDEIYREHRQEIFRRIDRLFAGLLAFEWLAAMVAALLISPWTWDGPRWSVHLHVWAAVWLAGLVVLPPIALALLRPGREGTRQLIAVAQMLIGAILIHISGGRIETHFHIFGSLAFLAFYRDWRVLLVASGVVAADHILRGMFWPESIYGVLFTQPWRWFEHIAWVAFEDVFLIRSCLRGRGEMRSIARKRAQLELIRARLTAEFEARTEQLRVSEARYATIFERALDPIVTMDHRGRIIDFNPAAEAAFGRDRAEVLGQDFAALVIPPRLRESHRPGLDRFLGEGSARSIAHRVEVPAVRGDGSEFAAEVTINVVTGLGDSLYTAFIRDVTDRKRAEHELDYRARHDALTGLPNRDDFQTRLARTVERINHQAGPPANRAAVLLVDLDRFKEINDELGHHCGDIVLRRISPRLRDSVAAAGPEGSIAARLGGDEFGVILPGADLAGASRCAEAILEAIRAPIHVDGQDLDVGASIGIALAPSHAAEPVALLQCADMAMYAAKRGRAGYLPYTPGQNGPAPKRLAMIGELRRGIEAGQLLLHYQPKVNLRTGRWEGAEALARWLHPGDGLLQPDRFIPLAEHSGLIRPLSLWALQTALLQGASWRRDGLEVGIAVNLAADNLNDPNLYESLAGLVKISGVPPGSFTVEVTESAMLTDPTVAREFLARLRDLGLRVAIDDFGTGCSSLDHLRTMPIDEIKIDTSFVTNLLRDDRDASIVRAVLDLARRLDLHVVAEGVEDLETAERLMELGCETAQGYYFSRPLHPARFTELMARDPAELACR